MTDYIVRVKEAAVDTAIEIPDSARDVEIEYFTVEHTQQGIGGGSEIEHRCRVKYLEKQGDSIQ